MIKFKNMITEDYVSFEIAKLLKEKGFVIPYDSFRGVYINGIFKRLNPGDGYGCNLEDEIVDVCSLQLAMKWLREVHSIAIETEWEHLWYAYIKPMTSKPSEEDYYQCKSSKYEEVCESAIKYCLENLQI